MSGDAENPERGPIPGHEEASMAVPQQKEMIAIGQFAVLIEAGFRAFHSGQIEVARASERFNIMKLKTVWLFLFIVPVFVVAVLWLLLAHLEPDDLPKVVNRLIDLAVGGAGGLALGVAVGASIAAKRQDKSN